MISKKGEFILIGSIIIEDIDEIKGLTVFEEAIGTNSNVEQQDDH